MIATTPTTEQTTAIAITAVEDRPPPLFIESVESVNVPDVEVFDTEVDVDEVEVEVEVDVFDTEVDVEVLVPEVEVDVAVLVPEVEVDADDVVTPISQRVPLKPAPQEHVPFPNIPPLHEP